MSSILEGTLAGQVADALRGAAVPRALTLRRTPITGYDDFGSPIMGDPVDYAAEGWRETLDAAYAATAGIFLTDVRIIILADGLTVQPSAGDDIKLGDEWYHVRAIDGIDPAGATYVCRAYLTEAPDDA